MSPAQSEPDTAMPVRDARTLIEMLEIRARETPRRTAFTFAGEPWTFSRLWEEIGRFAGHLRAMGVARGDRVVLALPNSHEFFSAFYGVQRAGGTAVPVFPASGPERVLAISRLCGAGIVVVPSSLPQRQIAAFRPVAAAAGIQIATVADAGADGTPGDFPRVEPDDVAFLQYTSGSTGNPKGVMLSQANLITNIGQLIAGMRITEAERFVSWLPVYHDMGLILKTMVPFYLAADLYLYPTSLADVGAWLSAIQEHRATFTAAPDFAYRLCLRYLRDPDRYDLSSLRVALNAAEPVRKQTIERFEEVFHLKNVMVAGYGLAEATVGVSMWTPGTRNKVDERGFVSVGPPFPGVEARILVEGEDGGTERFGRPGEIGEILLRSTAGCRGYYGNPEETRRLFRSDGYLYTGDLGYLDDDGNLFIVSRKKNVILTAGRTIAPQEVEEIVDRQPMVRFTAALGIDRGGTEGEQLYVFAEVRTAGPGGTPLPPEAMNDAATAIVADLHRQLGLRPARVYLLRPHAIPLTHNGKVRHAFLKEKYLEGQLRSEDAIVFPPG